MVTKLTEINDTSNNVFDIHKERQDAAGGNRSAPLLVRSHSRHHKLSLLVSQPARLLWKIRNEKESRDADQHRHHAFQDKDPSPITQTVDTVHFGDRAGKKTAESGGCQDGTPENREAPLRFLSLIPEAENIKTYVLLSVVFVSYRLFNCTYFLETLPLQLTLERISSQEVRCSF